MQEKPANTEQYCKDLQDLLNRGMAGDNSVLPAIREAFAAHPELSKQYGDLVSHAEHELIGATFGKDVIAREAIAKRLADERARLAVSSSSPLENMLIERTAVCWLAVYLAELDLTQVRKYSPDVPQLIDAAVKRLDRAHARHLSASKALATVQKLLKPAPSVLDLLGTPPSEKTIHRRRPTAASPAEGAPVAN